ncbi:MAG: hypothetical protein IH977_00510 [Nitrospinae bacterium]|nr:hypothetical protein [Nitrospinota bacterium]
MTRAPNGDLIIADDSADRFKRVTTTGGVVVSNFLTEFQLETGIVGGEVDLDGGIAFDDLGNFFFAEENTDNIYMVDAMLIGSIFVSKADIMAVTGVTPDLE